MLIDIIAGAQQDFVKIAPIIDAIHRETQQQSNITYRLVYTGQHKQLSADFITKLGIPYPHISLETGSGTEAEQTGTIMVRYEKVLAAEKPDMVILVGDTNAAVACSVTAKKAGDIIICCLDAGLRNNAATQDEINRIVTDSITDHFFTSSHIANEHLRQMGIVEERIFFAGNTLADSLVKHKAHFLPPPLWGKLNLQPQNYFIVTLHKKENTELIKLKTALIATIRSSQGLPIILPLYPEIRKTIENIGIRAPNLFITEFQDYFHFGYLLQNAKVVITDSGSIQEMTTLMHVPCMTVGQNTEQQETLLNGTNELIGTNPNNIPAALRKIFLSQWKKGGIPYLWDGNAGERIMHVLKNLNKQEAISSGKY